MTEGNHPDRDERLKVISEVSKLIVKSMRETGYTTNKCLTASTAQEQTAPWTSVQTLWEVISHCSNKRFVASGHSEVREQCQKYYELTTWQCSRTVCLATQDYSPSFTLSIYPDEPRCISTVSSITLLPPRLHRYTQTAKLCHQRFLSVHTPLNWVFCWFTLGLLYSSNRFWLVFQQNNNRHLHIQGWQVVIFSLAVLTDFISYIFIAERNVCFLLLGYLQMKNPVVTLHARLTI